MTEKTLRYPTVLFDWGDTVIDGISEVLDYLRSSGRRIALATSANISDEDQIRGALARGELNQYFSHIYCFKNTHLPFGQVFYRHILSDLEIPASDVLMVGDSFERDACAANATGIFAVWFNTKSEKTHKDELHITVHSMLELRAFFQSVDEVTKQ